MKDLLKELYFRLYRAFAILIIVLAIGTGGLYLFGQGDWSLEDCLYMTVITLGSVGYGEIVPVDKVPHARLFVIFIILLGMGGVMYFTSAVVALFVEGDLRKFWRKRNMESTISRLMNHIIVCGGGTTGRLIVDELLTTRTPFVVIEMNEDRVKEIRDRYHEHEVPYVIGDATDQGTLAAAGIERARGLIVALPEDKDCLIVTITARQMRRDLRVVSKCHEPDYIPRINKAGADTVVSPNVIGAMRIVSEMIRPTVTQFLDLMLRDKEKNLRIEQVEIAAGSELTGKRLADTTIRKITELLVIAARNEKTGKYDYNPGPNFVIEDGTVLIVLGSTDDVIKLRRLCGTLT